MTRETDARDEIERYSDTTPRNERTHRKSPDTRTEETDPRASGTGSGISPHLSGEPTTVDVEGVSATLLGVPVVPLREFVYDHRRSQLQDREETRQIALFDVENTGDRPLHWQPSRTTFVGDDDYTYQQARLSLDPTALGPGCHTRRVEVHPGRRARVVTLVERLPPDVDVAEIVHSVSRRQHAGTRRLMFAVG